MDSAHVGAPEGQEIKKSASVFFIFSGFKKLKFLKDLKGTQIFFPHPRKSDSLSLLKETLPVEHKQVHQWEGRRIASCLISHNQIILNMGEMQKQTKGGRVGFASPPSPADRVHVPAGKPVDCRPRGPALRHGAGAQRLFIASLIEIHLLLNFQRKEKAEHPPPAPPSPLPSPPFFNQKGF